MEGFGHSHRRGSYKQLHDDWAADPVGMLADLTGGGSAEPPSMSPWFSRSAALPSSSPAQGGFMLATNLSSSQQQPQPPPPHSLSSLTHHHQQQQQQQQSLPLSRSDSSSASQSQDSPPPLPLLWGEVRDRGDGEERGGGGKDGEKWPSRPLWREGWRAEGVVCSVPRLQQHPPPSQSPLDHTRLLPLLDHPRDRRGHSLPLHSTDLQFHIREVEEEHLSLTPEPRPSHQLPPLPEQFGCSKLKRTPIADPLGVPPGLPSKLNLDPTSVALLLRKSAAAICCNVGYHSTSLRALDTLAGVLGDYMSRLCKQLSIHSEQQQLLQLSSGNACSQDPLERSLWSCGVQGRAELHRYWKMEVEAGVQRLQRRAEELHDPPPTSPPPPPPPLTSSSRPLSLSTWPPDLSNERGDEELSLDEALNADMAIVAPASTPDPGGVQMFIPDIAAQEPEGFVLLIPDFPTRKRLRTSGSFTE